MAETAPRCRLYLVLPASPPPAIERSLTEALDTTDVACLLLSAAATADPALDARLRELTMAREPGKLASSIAFAVSAAATTDAERMLASLRSQ